MKSKLFIYSILIMIIVFSACSNNWIDEDEAEKELISKIFECINNEDKEGLKILFSKEVSDSHDLDNEIEGLFEFFDGKIVSYDDSSSCFTREKAEYGRQTLLAIEPLISNVKTDTGVTYEIIFFAYIVCEDDEEKVGLGGLKIIVDDEIEYLVGDW